jgi:hypothetical protein
VNSLGLYQIKNNIFMYMYFSFFTTKSFYYIPILDIIEMSYCNYDHENVFTNEVFSTSSLALLGNISIFTVSFGSLAIII